MEHWSAEASIQGEDSSAARRVSRHSHRVRHLRLAMPALAAGLVLTYALSATPPKIDRTFTEQFETLDETNEGLRLARPRYAGEDLSGQPFEIAATNATRASENDDQVQLERPEALRVGANGEEVRVRAETGVYDQAARVMTLTRAVELEQGDEQGRFKLTTDEAQVDVDSQVVTTNAEIRGSSASGSLRADRGTHYQTEDRLVLEGGVKILLNAVKEATDEGQDDAGSDG